MGVVLEMDDVSGELGVAHSIIAQKFQRENFNVTFSPVF